MEEQQKRRSIDEERRGGELFGKEMGERGCERETGNVREES